MEEIEVTGKNIIPPESGDSGYDLCAQAPVYIFPGEQGIISTGVKLNIPYPYIGILKDRVSLVLHRVYVQSGIIDSGYEGEISIVLENRGATSYHVEAGERIAQIVFLSAHHPELVRTTAIKGRRKGKEI